MDANELAVLEEKIQAMLALIKKLRNEKDKLVEENKELLEQVEAFHKQTKEETKSQQRMVAQLEEENKELVTERKEIKSRVEKILAALEGFSEEIE